MFGTRHTIRESGNLTHSDEEFAMHKLMSGAMLTGILVAAACTSGGPPVAATVTDGAGATAFVGARIIDGTGADPIENGVLVVRDGRIEAVGAVQIPDGAEQVDVSGRTIFPGLINTHGHVGDTVGLQGGNYSEQNIVDHLALYARYGITTVNSLGGDEAVAAGIRDAEDEDVDRARLLFAGPVVAGATPEEVTAQVNEIAAMNPDFIKIRVDDNLGTGAKMSPAVYQAVIDTAHANDIPLASHLYYLEDAKGLLSAGTDFVAHSVRDQPVDQELIDLLIENDVCYCPTLTREISTFVYEDRPDFFDDPFFLAEADPEILATLEQPERQERMRNSRSAQAYKEALRVALANLKAVADGGATVAMGTDSGPPARFQGYFEHMELALMAEAGLTTMQILVAATGDAAACLGRDDIGTLEPGRWADFVVVTDNPLDDIANTRSIESVWIAGNRVPDRN